MSAAKPAAKAVDSGRQLSREELAQIVEAIRQIGNLGKQLKSSGLSRRAVIILLQDVTGVSQANIKKVLDGLVDLPSVYLVRS